MYFFCTIIIARFKKDGTPNLAKSDTAFNVSIVDTTINNVLIFIQLIPGLLF